MSACLGVPPRRGILPLAPVPRASRSPELSSPEGAIKQQAPGGAALPRRADADNAFDKLKNQLGLGGVTTQDINRCQTVARSCALVFNWWSWYSRSANPGGRLEAITSRPLLLAAVGKEASHANQTTLYLTPLHGRADILKRLIAKVGEALQHVKAAAEQFRTMDPWGCMLRYISDRIAPVIGPPKPPPALQATG